jgi:hypothetical protein
VKLILGYDHDDEYWRQDINHHLSPKNSAGLVIFDDLEPIPVNYVSNEKIQKETNPIVSPSAVPIRLYVDREGSHILYDWVCTLA